MSRVNVRFRDKFRDRPTAEHMKIKVKQGGGLAPGRLRNGLTGSRSVQRCHGWTSLVKHVGRAADLMVLFRGSG